MSFWAATVISNLLSILPYGNKIIIFIWGGSILNNNTLIRFTTLHFILPFILLILIVIHLKIIHQEVTTKNKYIKSVNSILYFNLSYFIVKDNTLALTVVLVLILYVIIQQVENNIIVPKVMQKQLGLNPVVVIIVMLIGARMAGIIGLILAIPVATSIGVIVSDFIKKSELKKIKEGLDGQGTDATS